jgi:hypothetical protein
MDLKLDQWATTPPAGYPGTVSPPPAKRIAGWANGEEPPAGFFNHAWDALSDTQNELANLITGAGLTRSESNLSQVLQAVQSMIGRAQLKTAFTTVRAIHDTGIGPQTLNALAHGPDLADRTVAVGTAATIQTNGGAATNFFAATAATPFTGDFRDIIHEPMWGLFVAVGNVGEIQTSSNGTSWQRRANGGANFRKIATNKLGTCVAVGESGLVKRATNSTTWSTATGPFGASNFEGVAFGAGVFVAVTPYGGIASSPDGVTWTARRSEAIPAAGNGQVVYDTALGFIAAGSSNSGIVQSFDGITWTVIAAPPSSVQGPNSLIASPYGWARMSQSADGTAIVVSYNPTVVPLGFAADYVTSDQLTWMQFIDGQLWALGGTKIYLGGVL